MSDVPELDVTVVIPFGDDEDSVGAASRRVAAHMRALGLRFELLAVDEDSGDNSAAVLALLRAEIPEIKLVEAAPRRGFAAGARLARGRVLWLLDVARGDAPLAPVGWAVRRLEEDAADVVVVEGRYVLCRRTRVWRAIQHLRGRAAVFERRLVRRARSHRLRVESPPRATAAPSTGVVGERRFGRLLESLAPARFVGFLRSRA
jgi:hypothetical protein